MASPIIVTSQTDLQNYLTLTDTLYWNDPVRGGTFIHAASGSGYTIDNGIVFTSTPGGGSANGYWVRNYEPDILPQWFEIKNDGTLVASIDTKLENWTRKRFPITHRNAIHVQMLFIETLQTLNQPLRSFFIF